MYPSQYIPDIPCPQAARKQIKLQAPGQCTELACPRIPAASIHFLCKLCERDYSIGRPLYIRSSDCIQGNGEERKEEKESTKSQEKEKIRDTFMVSLFVCMQNAEWHFLPYFFCKKIIKGEIAYG